MNDSDRLVAAARDARLRAIAPYSHFLVGAALMTKSGDVVTGCNIENASYGLTMCAERVAVFKALSEGLSEFDAIVVAADSKRITAPCGPCRQILWEFGGDIPVTLANLSRVTGTHTFGQLLPLPFDGRLLT